MADFTITLSTNRNAKFTVYSFATQTQAIYTFNGTQNITLPAGLYAIVGQSTGSQNFFPISYNGIALSGTSATPTQISENATLLLNNTGSSSSMSWYYFQLVPSQISVDLSTLSGWNNVSAGSHTLKVKAKATGYRDSDLSAGASFTKAASGYVLAVTNNTDMPNDDFSVHLLVDPFTVYSAVISTGNSMIFSLPAGADYCLYAGGCEYDEPNCTASGGVTILGFDTYALNFAITESGNLTIAGELE